MSVSVGEGERKERSKVDEEGVRVWERKGWRRRWRRCLALFLSPGGCRRKKEGWMKERKRREGEGSAVVVWWLCGGTKLNVWKAPDHLPKQRLGDESAMAGAIFA